MKVGEWILSRDYATGKTGGQKVEQVKVRHVPATLVVTLSTGEKIETTKEHPVYVVGEGFVPAGRLAIGNSIVTRAGPNTHEHLLAQPVSQVPVRQVRVLKVETKTHSNTVYNFIVGGFHTYFVGKSALWVHNPACSGTEEDPFGSSDQARHDVMNKAGIPTSQQPTSQILTPEGNQYRYEVPEPGGGTGEKVVTNHSPDEHHDLPHWEAGVVKPGRIDPSGRLGYYNADPITKIPKFKVFYK